MSRQNEVGGTCRWFRLREEMWSINRQRIRDTVDGCTGSGDTGIGAVTILIIVAG